MTILSTERVSSNAVIIPVIVTILCLVPFVNKAFHIDDPLFIWAAKHIQSDPLDFYGFAVDWGITEKQISDVTKNPPLACYYIALVGLLFGFSEVALHLAFLVPAVAVALGTYYLARQFCSQAVPATLAMVLTPAFLVSGTNVMCDIMMLAMWVWAILLWVRGIQTDKKLSLFFAAVLISMCALTKYFGMSLLGLLFFYSLMQKRKLGIWVLFFLIPIVVLAGYQWVTYSLYGRGLLSDAAAFATEQRWAGSEYFMKGLIGLAFTGGCVITGLFYTPLLWSRRVLVVGVILAVVLVFALTFEEKIGPVCTRDVGGIRWGLLTQIALMSVAGAGLLVLAAEDFYRCRDSKSLLLLLWVLGTFVFASLVNWVINARSILPIAPAAGILLMRRIDRSCKTDRHRGGFWSVSWPLVPAAIIAMLVCRADYILAGTARDAAGIIQKKFENRNLKIWFGGHWGFQYYMEAAGGVALDFKRSGPALEDGDVIVYPLNNTGIEPLSQSKVRPSETLQVGRRRWLATMDPWLGAGFYADAWGPLPFVIGPVKPEEYYFYIVN